MKKRILSIVLAVLMLVSVLPVSALAVDAETDAGAETQHPTSVSTASEDGAIHVDKTLVKNEDGSLSLKLEAFATNTVSTETTYDPLDIVLVLDVSGSMDYCINCGATWDGWSWDKGEGGYCPGQTKYTYEKKGFAKDLGETESPLYRATRRGYSEVEWCDGDHWPFSHAPGWYDGNERIRDNTILYKQVEVDRIKHQHRIEALKTAVGDFIDSVAAQRNSKGETIANRISIVKFAGKLQETPNEYKVGDDTYKEGGYTYNYSQVVKGLTDVNTGSNGLKDAVNKLTAAGATSADYGMELAAGVLGARTKDENSTELPKSVVILFTDGEPNHKNGFDDQVASDAITAAKTLKDGGTSVFTVGVFNGANPDVDVNNADKTNKYMHAVSSNYPNAAYTKSGSGRDESWNWNFGTRAENGAYYLAASNASELNAVFQAISQTVNSLTAKVDATSVLSDTLSDMFTFDVAEGTAKDAIKVYTQKVKSYDEATKTYTWEDAVEAKNVNVDVQGKKLTVSNFDYGANAVTTTEGSTELKGYKLVVTIPIKPDTNYTGWEQGTKYYDTNSIAEGSNAGLSYGDNGSKKLELEDSPEAPVTAYTVTYTDGVDNETVFADQVSTVLPGTATPAFNGDHTRAGYEFKGWNPTVAETVTADVTYIAQWERDPATPAELDLNGYIVKQIDDTGDTFKNDTTFTVNVAPASGGAGIDGTATLKAGTANFTFTDKLEISGETTFYVREDNGQIAGVKYDDTTYLLKVTTELDAEANAVTIASVFYSDDNGATWHEIDGTNGDKLVITNKYNKPVSYNVVYDWGTPYPSDQTLPTDTNSYASDAAARAAVDQTFKKGDTSNAKNGDQEGTWTFSGWDVGTLSGTTITFTGKWEFVGTNRSWTATKKAYNADGQEISEAEAGETVYYEITISNNGNVELENLFIRDYLDNGTANNDLEFTDLPAGLVMIKNSDGWYEGTLAKLRVGETVTIKAKYVVLEGTYKADNKVTIDGKPGDEADVTIKHYDYEIDLAIDKTVLSKRGTAPSESFEFEVYYYDSHNQKVVISGNEPLKVYVGEGYQNTYAEFSIHPTEEQMNNWPAERWTDENDITHYSHYAYVRELNGGTEGMSYVSAAVKGLVQWKHEPEISIAQFSTTANEKVELKLVSYETVEDAFYFTNEYTKPTGGEEVKPAKVGPQLNRDDHVAYIMGYPDGNVRPEGEITRAEACTIFFRLLTESSRDYYFSKTNDYTDVARSDWFNNAISTLSNAGIVTGYNDGTFRPNQPITRGEMAKIIANFANLNKGTKSFTDLAGHWSKSYVELAAGNGWIAGYPDGSFRPDQKITRAETVTMINRVLERVPAKESRLLSRSIMLTFPDNNPGDWYYIAIQEASNSHEYQRSVYESAGDEMWIRLIDNIDWTKLEK